MTPEDKAEIKQLFREMLHEVFLSKSITQVMAAELLNVSTKTIQRKISQGKIKTDKNGKISKEEFLRYKLNN